MHNPLLPAIPTNNSPVPTVQVISSSCTQMGHLEGSTHSLRPFIDQLTAHLVSTLLNNASSAPTTLTLSDPLPCWLPLWYIDFSLQMWYEEPAIFQLCSTHGPAPSLVLDSLSHRLRPQWVTGYCITLSTPRLLHVNCCELRSHLCT